MPSVRLRRLTLEGFGLFRAPAVFDLPAGIATFIAPNESGKSTFLSGLQAVLFGLPERGGPETWSTTRYRNWASPASFRGALWLRSEDAWHWIARDFATHEVLWQVAEPASPSPPGADAPIPSPTDAAWQKVFSGTHNPAGRGRVVEEYRRHLRDLLGLDDPALFRLTFCVAQDLDERSDEEAALRTERIPASLQGLLSGGGGRVGTALESLFDDFTEITRFTRDAEITRPGTTRPTNQHNDGRLEEVTDKIDALRARRQASAGNLSALRSLQEELDTLSREREAARASQQDRERLQRVWSDWARQREAQRDLQKQSVQLEKAIEQLAGERASGEELAAEFTRDYAEYAREDFAFEPAERALEELRGLTEALDSTRRAIEEASAEGAEHGTGNGATEAPGSTTAGAEPASTTAKGSDHAEGPWTTLFPGIAAAALPGQFGQVRDRIESQLARARELRERVAERERLEAEDPRKHPTARSGWISPILGLAAGVLVYLVAGVLGASPGLRLPITLLAAAAAAALPLLRRAARGQAEAALRAKREARREALTERLNVLQETVGPPNWRDRPLADLPAAWREPARFARAAGQGSLAAGPAGPLADWFASLAEETWERWAAEAEEEIRTGEARRLQEQRTHTLREQAAKRRAAAEARLAELAKRTEAAREPLSPLLEPSAGDPIRALERLRAARGLAERHGEITRTRAKLLEAQEAREEDDLRLKRQELADERHGIAGRLHDLEERHTSLRELGDAEPRRIQEEQDRLLAELETGRRHLEDLDTRLAALTTRLADEKAAVREGANVAVLELELRDREEGRARLIAERDSIAVAFKTLRQAEREFAATYREQLAERATVIFRTIGGKPERTLQLGEGFELRVREAGGQVCSPRQLSQGARDQLSLALRLAIAELLAAERSLPLLLDDPFLTFDAERLAAMRETLRELARERQILLLSHRADLADWGDPIGIA